MAADSAVMVIDASKGVEAQTRKLFKVCVMRDIPIFTFINKMDRDAQSPYDLLDEIEKELGIGTYPMNWPIGSGVDFKGVYDREKSEILAFEGDKELRGQHEVKAHEIDLNDAALELARGKFDTEFSGKGYREIEELSDTLNYTAKELGKASAFQHELLANVSHDLRTPLTMIGGYAEVMRDIPGENTPENVQVIIDETKRLTAFVNNILDLTKLQSGFETLKCDTVCLTEMLESIRTRYFNLTKNDGYTVEIQADEDAYVVCDEAKISQAFYNLMDNAVNHTGADKTVVIRQILTDKKVRIEIADSGEGIAPEELPYIWERYYRAKQTAHKRAVVGSGIGLSIVKSVFELHKLLYGVESEVGKGTTFWVEFDRVKV